MMAALYYFSLLLLIPGALLALYYVAVERAATSGSLAVLFARLIALLDWLAWSGFIALAGALTLLVAAGGFPRTRPFGAMLLFVLALASLFTIWRLEAHARDGGEWSFPLLCLLSMAASGAVVWRALAQPAGH
jgi:hypothetical protein